MARVRKQGDLRPMADDRSAMAELRNILVSREPLYARAAAVVDTAGLSWTRYWPRDSSDPQWHASAARQARVRTAQRGLLISPAAMPFAKARVACAGAHARGYTPPPLTTKQVLCERPLRHTPLIVLQFVNRMERRVIMLDRRQLPRNRVYYGGRVAFNSRSSTVDRVVRNFSLFGAKIEFEKLSHHCRRNRFRDRAQGHLVYGAWSGATAMRRAWCSPMCGQPFRWTGRASSGPAGVPTGG